MQSDREEDPFPAEEEEEEEKEEKEEKEWTIRKTGFPQRIVTPVPSKTPP